VRSEKTEFGEKSYQKVWPWIKERGSTSFGGVVQEKRKSKKYGEITIGGENRRAGAARERESVQGFGRAETPRAKTR